MKKILTYLSLLFITFIAISCGSRDKWNTQNAPNAPTNLTVVADNTQVYLKWNASSETTSYKIYYKVSSDPSYMQIGSTYITGCTVTGLTNGQTYYFVITALNAAGASGYSNKASVTLISGAPTDLTVVSEDQQVSLKWNATMGAASYNVYYATTTGGPYTKVNSTANAYYTVTGLTNGMTYYFVVTAVNASGESGYSNEAGVIPVLKKVYASGGTAPLKIAIDSSNNVWVTNFSSDTVAKLNPTGITIGTYNAGNGPGDLAIDNTGSVWVTNFTSDTVTKLSPSGITIGTYNAGNGPGHLAIDASGNVWVVDSYSSAVTELSPVGTTIGIYDVGTDSFLVDIAIDNAGNVWVTDEMSRNVAELSLTGTTIGTYGAGYMPMSIAIDPSGNVWVVNNSVGTVTELSPAGSTIGTYKVGISPEDIAIDATGNVWVTNYWSYTVTELSPTGSAMRNYQVGANPVGIAIDPSGNVWVADYGDNTVTELIGVATGPQYFPYTGPQWP